MSEEMDFGALFESVLYERRASAEAAAGFEQRLRARLAQDAAALQPRPIGARPFAFAESIRTQRSAASTWFAIGAHVIVLLAIFALASRHMTIAAPKQAVVSIVTAPPVPPPVLPALSRIGGGGGVHDLAAVSRGRLPKLAQQQVLPPMAPPAVAPKLAIEPTVVVQKDLKMADNNLPNLGMPNSSLNGISLGNGHGTGIGSGNGSGIGEGSGGNTGGGVMHIGGAVGKPVVLFAPDPEYSEEARRAKFSGNVEVYMWIDQHGNPSHVRVVRGVGMGLDEKAVEAARQYKFKPAMKDGKPVMVDMYLDVNFEIF
jgi:protein TonB